MKKFIRRTAGSRRKNKLKKTTKPYGPKGAAKKIIKILENIEELKIKKIFYNIKL